MVEVLEALSKNDELTSMQIAELTDCSMGSVTISLKRLMKDVSVNLELRKLTTEEKVEKYGHNFGCKVYVYKLLK